ncbi:MAG TPA: glycosyltransferase 87 family protein, partial [Candidatus Limnocylindrales bacterium]
PAFAYAAHEYPPVFAQLISPFTTLPWESFVLLWLVVQLGILLWLVGPRWLGLVLMLSPIQEAIWSGNLTFIYAGVAVLAIRYPAVWLIPLVSKVTPGIGILWYAVRREWRQLAIVVGLTGAVVAISLVTVPDTWAAWFDWVRANGSAAGPQGLVNAVPVPLWLRLAGAAAIVTWGALRNQPWVLVVPLWLAQPTAWWTDLVMLATPLTPWLRRQG